MLQNIKEKATDTYNKTFDKNLWEERYEKFNEEKQDEAQKSNKDSTLNAMKNNIAQATNFIGNKADQAKQALQLQATKFDQSVKNALLAQKKSLNRWISAKVDDKIAVSLKKVEPKITSQVEKSIPCNCIKGFANDFALSLWKDISDMVRFEFRVQMESPVLNIEARPPSSRILKPWYKFRNWLLYILYPYDLDQATHMRRWQFILVKCISSIPFGGIQQIFFFIVFLAIDKVFFFILIFNQKKSEEFQIVNFILDFKNMQFFTNGILASIIGFFQYYYCGALIPSYDLTHQIKEPRINICLTHGPGVEQHLILWTVGYFSQVILIWIAFALLSRTKSSADFISDTLKIEKQKRGGRLTSFMIYDLVCFAFVLSSGSLLYYFYYFDQENPLKYIYLIGSLINFLQISYGMLSFPFSVFMIGIFVRMFTNAVPTSYDQEGNCVPMISNLKITYKEIPINEDEDPIDIEDALKEQ